MYDRSSGGSPGRDARITGVTPTRSIEGGEPGDEEMLTVDDGVMNGHARFTPGAMTTVPDPPSTVPLGGAGGATVASELGAAMLGAGDCGWRWTVGMSLVGGSGAPSVRRAPATGGGSG